VIEFNALTDAIGPAAQDHHLAHVLRRALGLLVVGGVEVGRVGLKLRRTGVYAFVDRPDVVGQALLTHVVLGATGKIGQTAVGEAALFGLAQGLGAEVAQTLSSQLPLQLRKLLYLI